MKGIVNEKDGTNLRQTYDQNKGWVKLYTTNICNSAQKENVKLGWAKHIPNFTENGQKWKIRFTEHAQHFFYLETEKKWFLFILETLGDFAEHAKFCSIFITEPFCWKKLTFCLTQTVVFSLGEITNVCSVTGPSGTYFVLFFDYFYQYFYVPKGLKII